MNPEFKLDNFKQGAQKLKPKTTNGSNIFVCKTANEWIVDASAKDIPESLYLSIWHEGEIGFLIGSTNTGKSLLAVKLALDIAKNRKVIYVDLEMSDIQFRLRYTENGNEYKFPENFLRVEFKDKYAIPDKEDTTDYIIKCFEEIRSTHKSKVIIIDNVTYLGSSLGTSKDVLPLLRKLKDWQRSTEGLSLLILAHTPKRPDSQPLTINDIFGSSMQGNFCDVAFAIGHSVLDNHWRYVKQLKARLCAIEYDSTNVIIYEINKQNDGLLSLDFKEYKSEREHTIKEYDPTENPLETSWEIAYNFKKEGKNYSEIGLEMNVSHTTASKYCKKHEAILNNKKTDK